MKSINQTIVAPTTSLTNQAIALIRISGDEAFDIINKLIKYPIDKTKNVLFKKLYDEKELVDEVIITSFVAPNSFTGEDVIEIACHGGILNTQRIIKLIIKKGARMANKGEFSQRAFLNNKIDLIQAEGINDLIFAKNEMALKIGVNNMGGIYNNGILEIKNQLLDVISRIQVSIDYPDYDDVEGSSIDELTLSLEKINVYVDKLLKRSKLANSITNGIKTAIVGKTNVGKSSLLNALIQEERAIVTDIEGTTRDIVTGQINFQNLTLDLVDTAGIRKTNDIVEKIGIEKSLNVIDNSDFILLVVNAENIYDQDNKDLISKIGDKKHLIVVNKKDLISNKDIIEISKKFNNVIFTNASNYDVDDLINCIEKMFLNEELLKNENLVLINIEQINLVEQIKDKLLKSLNSILEGMPIDIVNVDLNVAWNLLNELVGEQYDEEIIDNIFKKYCLGK
ncbi:tRNA uridine-5-carboxymethylaminomethyl(34) synthesis GTPase MnmE [Mesoplasma corruscae]|uniref:tRNA modification GTPase MnmE n=1 Tax=Mesoplasma corruscae TaxID=216874 RepID=A0A2S5RH81_9MOLU|nr:tRNA uridine-5-carboxymethylaminomethyl(34) synthesis GTPase MnmE [Mesoplasma corruscae]PPE06663.1 tRNA modification GTPase TrmE [Mesoplasma corruscae]